MKAFIGIVYANDGLLIGGIKEHASYPIACSKCAKKWVDSCIEVNASANREVGAYAIKETEHDTPISCVCAEENVLHETSN